MKSTQSHWISTTPHQPNRNESKVQTFYLCYQGAHSSCKRVRIHLNLVHYCHKSFTMNLMDFCQHNQMDWLITFVVFGKFSFLNLNWKSANYLDGTTDCFEYNVIVFSGKFPGEKKIKEATMISVVFLFQFYLRNWWGKCRCSTS